MSLGVSYELFWKLSPIKIKPFIRADKMRRKRIDEEQWYLGQYVVSAVARVLSSGKTNYIEHPVLEDILLTQEELDEKEIRQMIANEEQFRAISLAQGKSETKLDKGGKG